MVFKDIFCFNMREKEQREVEFFCLTNLVDFFYRIFEWHDKGDSLHIIYLDFSKASDKDPQNRLLKKYEGYGI